MLPAKSALGLEFAMVVVVEIERISVSALAVGTVGSKGICARRAGLTRDCVGGVRNKFFRICLFRCSCTLAISTPSDLVLAAFEGRKEFGRRGG